MKIEVLDKGFVELVDQLGSDLTVVNSARVSFGARKEELDGRDRKLMRYLAKNKHWSPFRHIMVQFHIKAPEFVMRQCYDPDTEVLTEAGWKCWPDVTTDDRLAAVSETGTYQFESPTDMIRKHYTGKMIQFKSQSVDLLVTPDHRMFVSKRDRSAPEGWGSFHIEEAANVNGEYRLPVLPSQRIERGNHSQFMYGLLYGMYLGDGSSASSPNRIVFSVQKSRKTQVLQQLYRYFNLNAHIRLQTEQGYNVFHFDNPDTVLFSGKTDTKAIDFDRIPNTKAFLLGLLKGLLSSDGNYKTNLKSTWRYATSSRVLADSIYRLCDILGFMVNEYVANTGLITLNINRNKHRHLLPKYRSEVDYEGMVYCATVSTGLLLVRRNGKAAVCGNCYKHVVGIETTSSYPTKDHAWNELSGRYVEIKDFYYPAEWRAQSDDNKQASDGLVEDQEGARLKFEANMILIQEQYKQLLDLGVAKEMARMILPLNLYTEVYWTASFQAVANFLELRDHSHAQWEIQQYAKALRVIMQKQFPETMEAWGL